MVCHWHHLIETAVEASNFWYHPNYSSSHIWPVNAVTSKPMHAHTICKEVHINLVLSSYMSSENVITNPCCSTNNFLHNLVIRYIADYICIITFWPSMWHRIQSLRSGKWTFTAPVIALCGFLLASSYGLALILSKLCLCTNTHVNIAGKCVENPYKWQW